MMTGKNLQLWLCLLLLPVPTFAINGFLNGIANTFLSFLDPILDPLWDALARSTCDAVEDLFSVGSFCDCDGDFSVAGGLEAGVLCGLTQPVCLFGGEYFCGTSSFEADWSSTNGFTKARACIDFESGLPDSIPFVGDFLEFPELCVRADPDLATASLFKFCEVELGGTRCRTCDICASGADVTFDCSNINVNPISLGGITIPGPNLNGNCVGLGIIVNIAGQSRSVRAFGAPADD